MGAEVGATTSTFPYSSRMRDYLIATGRAPVARAADKASSQGFLSPDKDTEYDQLIEIDLSKVEPTINGPFTPDLATPISKFGEFVKSQGWKDEFSAALIGSCTNSSYEDMVCDFSRTRVEFSLTQWHRPLSPTLPGRPRPQVSRLKSLSYAPLAPSRSVQPLKETMLLLHWRMLGLSFSPMHVVPALDNGSETTSREKRMASLVSMRLDNFLRLRSHFDQLQPQLQISK